MGELGAIRAKHNERCDWPMKECWDQNMGWVHCICATHGFDDCLWHMNNKKPLSDK